MAAAEAPPDEANATRDPWEVSSEEGSEEEEEEEEELDPHRFDAMSQDVYDPAPDESANYGKADFWDERYMFQDDPFEWYHSYETLSDIIGQYVATAVAGAALFHFPKPASNQVHRGPGVEYFDLWVWE